jgi:hypothetical protein
VKTDAFISDEEEAITEKLQQSSLLANSRVQEQLKNLKFDPN